MRPTTSTFKPPNQANKSSPTLTIIAPSDTQQRVKRAPFHELILELLRASPKLALTLLRLVLDRRGPSKTSVCPDNMDFVDWRMVPYRADLIYTLRDQDQTPRHAAIYEVQLNRDPDKQYTWPFYTTAARVRWRCATSLIVITLKRSLVTWCRRPIRFDTAGSTLYPYVIGPSDIPKITSPAKAKACPELAVLSIAAHCRSPEAIAIAKAALLACDDLDRHRAALYNDFIAAHLDEATARAVREYMILEGYEYQSKFARHYYSQGREEGFDQGREEGFNQGQKQGRDQGQKEGQKEGFDQGRRTLAAVLIEQLRQRFGAVPAADADTVRNADADSLQRWGGLVLSAASLDDLLRS